MNELKHEPFFKLVIRFGIIFFILIFIMETGFSILKNSSFSIMLKQYFLDGNWQNYLARLFLMAVVYGLFMAGYYKFIKK